jgi:pimeloyl-ACP methyl ester carboxylesterase
LQAAPDLAWRGGKVNRGLIARPPAVQLAAGRQRREGVRAMDFLDTAQGRRIAFERLAGEGPELAFLPGLRSDMGGTKALTLWEWARAAGRAMLRFDYSGHGASAGRFEDGTIGQWAEDAVAAIWARPGKKLLVGSSMGGWLALLLARARPEDVAGVVAIAGAPDFTSAAPPWPPRSQAQERELRQTGRIVAASAYDEAPTVYTRALIEDGAAHSVFARPLALPMPLRLLHGTADAEVPPAVALALLDHARGDVRLTLVKGADHRFSTPDCLALVQATVAAMPC